MEGNDSVHDVVVAGRIRCAVAVNVDVFVDIMMVWMCSRSSDLMNSRGAQLVAANMHRWSLDCGYTLMTKKLLMEVIVLVVVVGSHRGRWRFSVSVCCCYCMSYGRGFKQWEVFLCGGCDAINLLNNERRYFMVNITKPSPDSELHIRTCGFP